jgi:hypothetical protein
VGLIKERRGKMFYKNINCEDLEYWDYPHEIEAHGLEELYYHDYLRETNQTT